MWGVNTGLNRGFGVLRCGPKRWKGCTQHIKTHHVPLPTLKSKGEDADRACMYYVCETILLIFIKISLKTHVTNFIWGSQRKLFDEKQQKSYVSVPLKGYISKYYVLNVLFGRYPHGKMLYSKLCVCVRKIWTTRQIPSGCETTAYI
jgi:hypothetical protein